MTVKVQLVIYYFTTYLKINTFWIHKIIFISLLGKLFTIKNYKKWKELEARKEILPKWTKKFVRGWGVPWVVWENPNNTKYKIKIKSN